jgi:hypothetical protein
MRRTSIGDGRCSTRAAAPAGCSSPGCRQVSTSTAATPRPTWSSAAATARGPREPDGTLVLDNEVPYSNAGRWSWWAERPGLPRPWPVEPERGTAPD